MTDARANFVYIYKDKSICSVFYRTFNSVEAKMSTSNRYVASSSRNDVEREGKVHQIGEDQMVAINERLEQDSAIIGELGCTVIVLLLVCQLFVLLAMVIYALYQNLMFNSLPSPVYVREYNITHAKNFTAVYPNLQLWNVTHVLTNLTNFTVTP